MSFPFNKEVINSIMGWDKKPRVGRTPDLLRKGHAHGVERDPDYKLEIEDGLIEYEVDKAPRQERVVLVKQLADGRYTFVTDTGSYIHVTLPELHDMIQQVEDSDNG